MTEPTPDRGAAQADAGRPDEDRGISDVGLPHPGDDARTADADAEVDEAALDEVFPPADGTA